MAASWSTDVIHAVERWIAVQGRPSGSGPCTLDELLRGLRAAGPAPLAQALAEKRPAGPPRSRAEAVGLLGPQVDAFRACLSPGVRLVWGLPGTGARQVLARAIEELVRDGRRVLLVSTAEVAVDNALYAVVRRMSPSPGVAIRVGPAALRELADVQLEHLAAAAVSEVDQQCDAVAARLREIEGVDAQIERLRDELRDFDEPAYRAAASRVAAEHQVEDLRSRLREAEAGANLARRAAVTAATDLRAALAARAELDPVRDALEQERRAAAGLAALEERRRALQLVRATLEAQPPVGWRARRRQQRDLDATDTDARRFAVAAADGRRRWLDLQLRARAAIGEHSRADVDRADLRVAYAGDGVARADEQYRRAREVLVGLRSAIEDVEVSNRPSEEDRRLVADSEARNLPARHARLLELVDRQQGHARLRGPLDARHRELVDRARRLRAAAEAEIVRAASVVATSLVRSRVHPALAHAEFDVVLVDGAGVAALAEVLLVLCRATTTAVLFGDFRQPGPVHGEAVRDDPGAGLERWVRATCFSHVGIGDPARVTAGGSAVAPARV